MRRSDRPTVLPKAIILLWSVTAFGDTFLLRTDGTSTGSDRRNALALVLTHRWDFGNVCTMPRQLRLEYPGAMYHLMSRGDRREDICETTLSVKQIAERLHLGKLKGARTNLHKFMNPPQNESLQIRLEI
jgi:hypothetical protein